jgi:hypothetical protein
MTEIMPEQVITRATPVQVSSTITTAPGDSRTAYLLRKNAWEWSAEDIREYVMGEIIKRHPETVRDAPKEVAIFRSFVNRYSSPESGSEDAWIIAHLAFEVHNGYWRNAPIGATRFCKNNDQYFSDPLLAQMKG